MTRAALQRRLAAALPLVAIVAVLAGLFLASGDADDDRRSVGRPAVVAIPAALSVPPAAETGRGPSTRFSPTTGRSEVQLCGGAWVATDESGAPDSEAMATIQEPLQRQAERDVAARLLASADPRDRATGLELRWMSSRISTGNGLPDAEGRAAHEALVDLATAVRDPEVYGTALAMCDRLALPAAASDSAALPSRCALLSAAQWAALDPGNAVPWLARADEASRAGDRQGEDEALWRAAQATRHASSYGASLERVLRLTGDDSGWGTLGLAVSTIGLHAARVTSSSAYLVRRGCSSGALADPGRRERCDAVASRLVAVGDTLLDRAVGSGIGKRLGWSDERLAAIREETDALGSTLGALESEAAPTDCSALRRDVDRMRAIGRLGEIGALREAMAAAKAGAAPVPLR